MGTTVGRIKNIIEQNGGPPSVESRAFVGVAEGIDEIKDLIKNSHNIQMVGSRESDFGDKKAKALMIVIEKMFEEYKNRGRSQFYNHQIDELFEKAKVINQAENKTDFQSAIAGL